MTTLLALALAALATASPLPTYSDFYKLRIQVPSPALDFTPPIHDRYLVSVHIGAGMDMPTPAPSSTSSSSSSTFHTNGTDADLWAARGTVVVGFGPYAQAWRTVRSPDDPDRNSAVLQYGPGTEGVRVIEDRGDLMLGPGQYMVCDRGLPYGLAVEMTTGAVPEGCVPVRLLPVCAEGDDGVDGRQQADQTVYRTRCQKL